MPTTVSRPTKKISTQVLDNEDELWRTLSFCIVRTYIHYLLCQGQPNSNHSNHFRIPYWVVQLEPEQVGRRVGWWAGQVVTVDCNTPIAADGVTNSSKNSPQFVTSSTQQHALRFSYTDGYSLVKILGFDVQVTLHRDKLTFRLPCIVINWRSGYRASW